MGAPTISSKFRLLPQSDFQPGEAASAVISAKMPEHRRCRTRSTDLPAAAAAIMARAAVESCRDEDMELSLCGAPLVARGARNVLWPRRECRPGAGRRAAAAGRR